MAKRRIRYLAVLALATACTGGGEDAPRAGNADIPVVSAGSGGGGIGETGQAEDASSSADVSTSVESSTEAPTTAPTTAAPTTTAPTTEAPTTAAPITAATAAPTTATTAGGTIIRSESASFTSPSGNIACLLDSLAGASCYITEKQWTIDPPSGCQDDFGNALDVTAGGAVFSCYTDFPWNFNAAPLAYGDAVATGEFICESAQTGVTCSNGAGSGFKVARARADLF